MSNKNTTFPYTSHNHIKLRNNQKEIYKKTPNNAKNKKKKNSGRCNLNIAKEICGKLMMMNQREE